MPSLFFSQSAVARVSGVESRFIERFEVWESVVMVVFEKGLALRPRFLSKKSFYADFVESRKNSRSPSSYSQKQNTLLEISKTIIPMKSRLITIIVLFASVETIGIRFNSWVEGSVSMVTRC